MISLYISELYLNRLTLYFLLHLFPFFKLYVVFSELHACETWFVSFPCWVEFQRGNAPNPHPSVVGYVFKDVRLHFYKHWVLAN